MNQKKYYLFILAVSILSFNATSQNIDSLDTAFRKGRWLTGLSGTISSSTTEVKNADFKSSSNNYGINIETGKFIKDRFLLGGRFQANQSSTNGTVERTTETFYIGPFTNYYLTDNKTGSLFATASLGYVRYRDETQLQLVQENGEGGGLGAIVGLGYSYTINDFIAFDLGLNVNLFWVDIEQESLPSQTVANTSIASNDISFSFGFNIILDDFFF
ncbi:outer membrane beta-barrel protein [uncultured Algibacter sp.]|uniref:outer membrane beta-barrel protein n=1 Tax=uncultured Algibacter sp. TaxID=298659 RepID=UPI0026087854|nr:outer membrane beta-barrel protein [uncultured Algibacter sp.]